MTTPLIVITVEGGVIQDIAVSLQARVVIVDGDTEGCEPEGLVELAGVTQHVADHGTIMPSPSSDSYLKAVLLCLKN